MTDGTILIRGNVGSEAGASMQARHAGCGGSCGDAPGFNMIAGSILVFGSCGRRPGAGMRRGTIGLFGHGADHAAAHLPPRRPLPAAFSPAALSRAHSTRIFRSTGACSTSELLLSHGDLVALGKGEVWMRTN